MKYLYLLSLGLLFVSGCAQNNVLSQHTFELVGQAITSSQLSCETVADASFYTEGPMKEGEITFKLSKGTDKLAIKIGGEFISIISAASVGQGESESEKWPLLKNDDEHLIAGSFQEGPFGSSLYSFVLNKKTGFAVWSRAEPNFLYVPSAGGFFQYLTCK